MCHRGGGRRRSGVDAAGQLALADGEQMTGTVAAVVVLLLAVLIGLWYAQGGNSMNYYQREVNGAMDRQSTRPKKRCRRR